MNVDRNAQAPFRGVVLDSWAIGGTQPARWIEPLDILNLAVGTYGPRRAS